MGGSQIQAVIAGIIVLVVSLVLFSPMAKGADVLYREFIAHCEINKDSFLKLSDGKGGTVLTTIAGTAPLCAYPADTSITAGTALVDEDGTTRVGISTQAQTDIAGSVWVPPNENLNQFASINRLVLSLLPLVIVVGFMSTSFMSIYQNRNSAAGGIAAALKAEITVLIVALIAIFVSPIALDYIGSSAEVVSGGTLSNTSQFGEIMELLFGFMPVGLVLGIIGMIGWRAKSSYGNMRGQGGGGMLS